MENPEKYKVGKVCAKHPELRGKRYISNSLCPECKRANTKEWKDSKKDDLHKSRVDYHAKKKEEVFKEYGGCCDLCGEDDIDVLTIDHINGNGAQHRKEVPASRITKWLKDNGYPHGYRVLCFNCNFKSHMYTIRGRGPLVTLRTLQNDIVRWADRTFPHRTVEDILRKLEEERKELLDGMITGDEYADIFILVMDLAAQHGIDIQKALVDKLEINRKREWKLNPDTNTMQHVEGT